MNMNPAEAPTVFVIFGASGDLTWRKLAPALFDLAEQEALPERLAIVGVGRSSQTDEKLREHLQRGVAKLGRGKTETRRWKEFRKKIAYVQGDCKMHKTYQALVKRITAIEKQWGTPAQRIFYFATPPSQFGEIPPRLDKAGLVNERTRVVVEKPFACDLKSAQELNRVLADHFDETQIFRIDHYLGKETVQNILAFRFANPTFEPIWNHHYIQHVAITVAEDAGVGQRGGYYDQTGALRDMMQNHLMQLFCIVAMEPMLSFDANEVRNKKLDVLRAVRPIPPDAVQDFAVRGQYEIGWVLGKKVRAYCEEQDVAPDSQTESFAALKLLVDNWRWKGVPFYLRTGKRLARRVSKISIHFRAVPHQAFPAEAVRDWQPARLIMLIQPDEGIILRMQAKQPGPELHLRGVNLQFNYAQAFRRASPDAYETLLLDTMRNDPTLFMRFDEVETAWSILEPVLETWSSSVPADFPNYAAGSWGPAASAALLARAGHSWPLPSTLATRPLKRR